MRSIVSENLSKYVIMLISKLPEMMKKCYVQSRVKICLLRFYVTSEFNSEFTFLQLDRDVYCNKINHFMPQLF